MIGDLRSHQVMVGQLSAAFPNINIISEETNSKIKDGEQVKFNLVNKFKLIDQLKNLQINRHVALSELTIWVDPLGKFDFYFSAFLLRFFQNLIFLPSF